MKYRIRVDVANKKDGDGKMEVLISKIAGLTLSMIEATYYPKDWNVKYEEDINKCINKSIAQNDYYCYV